MYSHEHRKEKGIQNLCICVCQMKKLQISMYYVSARVSFYIYYYIITFLIWWNLWCIKYVSKLLYIFTKSSFLRLFSFLHRSYVNFFFIKYYMVERKIVLEHILILIFCLFAKKEVWQFILKIFEIKKVVTHELSISIRNKRTINFRKLIFFFFKFPKVI